MKGNGLYFEITENYTKDNLSEFVGKFAFIPHAFGHQYNNPGAICSDRIVGDFELIYFIGGEGYITVLEKEYVCRAGDVILITPFTKHKIQTSAETPHDNYWIHFDLYPFYMHDPFINFTIGKNGNKLNVGLSEKLLFLYRWIEEELKSGRPGSADIFNSALRQIILLVLQYCQNDSAYEKAESFQQYSREIIVINKSIDYIQNNINEKIQIADLCKQLYISESQLFKAFAKVLKMSPNHFILLCKIKKAEQMMKIEKASFKEISQTLGFSSPFYFSSVFKKFYQMSPSEYVSQLKLR